MCSLIKIFNISAIGWKIPQGPSRLGPNRSCILPRIFRSAQINISVNNKAPTPKTADPNKNKMAVCHPDGTPQLVKT